MSWPGVGRNGWILDLTSQPDFVMCREVEEPVLVPWILALVTRWN